ncbi:MAG: protein-methionine-sulfoxide reductase heme-binding subunit MsrQ, partial [Terriglobales bacterium]
HQYWLIGVRRMIGLFAFFYATLHFLTYIWLDQFFDVHSMVKDIAKRPFITVGFSAFVLLIPLALTSTARSIRRLGGKNWQRLHRLIYLTAILGVVHYFWLVKADLRKPIDYGIVLAILLAYRVSVWISEKRRVTLSSAPIPGQAEITKA